VDGTEQGDVESDAYVARHREGARRETSLRKRYSADDGERARGHEQADPEHSEDKRRQ
jgi:hypothetical protein